MAKKKSIIYNVPEISDIDYLIEIMELLNCKIEHKDDALIIDSSNVDVSFNYTITPSIQENSCVKDLNVTGYSLNNGEIISVVDNAPISNNILYKDGITTTSIRIHIKWTDDETATMDNKADTQTTVDETCKGNINVALNFIQLQN